MARNFGRFIGGARDTVEEFEDELVSEEVREPAGLYRR
jgi:Sec-independent protein translocase protein TatA